METFDPNGQKNAAEFKNPLNEADDKKSESKSSKKGSSSSKIFGVPHQASEAPKLFGESKDDDTKTEAPSLLAGLVSREESSSETPEATDVSAKEISSDETLSGDEARYATEAIITERQADVTDELAEAEQGSVQEIEAAANSALLDAMQDHLAAGDSPEAAIDAAVEETMSEINDLAEDALPENEDTMPNAPGDVLGDEDDENLIAQPVVTTPVASSPPPPVTPVAAPPPPPIPPSPPVQPGSVGGGPNNPNNPNTVLTTPNVVPAPVERRRNRASDMLVGGVVGYLAGRRRGRRKSERELLPIQKKLEQEVKNLNETIAQKESEVRYAAREQLAPKVAVRVQERPAATRSTEAIVPLPVESPATKPEAPQVEQTESPSPSPSRFEASHTENQSRPIETLDAKKVDWRVANFNEVLAMAATIEVRDKQHRRRNIKEMFERGSISREEVRRLIVEFARGASAETLRPRMKTIETMETSALAPEHSGSSSGEFNDAKQGSSGGQQSSEAAFLPSAQPQTTNSQTTADDHQTDIPPSIFSSLEHTSKPRDNQLKTVVAASAATGVIIAISLLLWLK